ncbi:MAG: hypothetical protein IJ422_00315 [Oscillospiraceae bacterium]|nr:hypothetical protein [Oscillospiraceae bacterium]
MDATCTEGGSKAYYTCSGCEDWFEDASGTVVIVDKTSVAIAALGHDMSDATCTEASYCQREGCEYTEGSALGHNYEVGWTYDAESHWHKCSRCDAKTGEEAHTPGAEATEETAQTCTICGYEITPALGHMHKLTKVDATVTCTEAGHKAYYICECGKWFVDAAGTVEITDKNSVLSEALGHMDADDDNKCDVCDAILGAEQPNTPDTPDDVPQTGDNSKTVLWTTALILSFAGLILCVLLRKKRYVA